MVLALSGCGSLFGDSPKIDRVREVRIYEEIPEEYLNCPLPSVIPEEILDALDEDLYNRVMVAEYFTNNETCAQNMARIRRLNAQYRELNQRNEGPTKNE